MNGEEEEKKKEGEREGEGNKEGRKEGRERTLLLLPQCRLTWSDIFSAAPSDVTPPHTLTHSHLTTILYPKKNCFFSATFLKQIVQKF